MSSKPLKVGFLMIFVFLIMVFVTSLPGVTFINYTDYLLMGIVLFAAGIVAIAFK